MNAYANHIHPLHVSREQMESLKQHFREIFFDDDENGFVLLSHAVYFNLFIAYKAHFISALPHLYYVVHHLSVPSN